MVNDIFSSILDGYSGALFNQKFCFRSHATDYTLMVVLYCKGDSAVIEQSMIKKLEIVNEVNQLCMTGSMEYVDINGDMGHFWGQTDAHCIVYIQELKDESDKIGNTALISKDGERRKIIHDFIISNTEMLGRHQNANIYKLHLISSNWYRCAANFSYSNFDKNDNSGIKSKNGEPIYKIIQEILNGSFKDFKAYDVDNIADETFETVFPDVKLKYLTKENDDVFSEVSYLQNKLISSKVFTEGLIDQLSFIVYDMHLHQYHVVKLNDTKTYIPCACPVTNLSLFGSLSERYLYQHPQQLASVVKKNIMQMYDSFFNRKMHTFDINKGFFSAVPILLENKTLLNVFHNVFDPNISSQKYEKLLEKLEETCFPGNIDNVSYEHNETNCNNDHNVYDNIIGSMMERDALIINTEGDVSHQPGNHFLITDDKTLGSPNSTTRESKNKTKRNSKLVGDFFIFKSRHIIMPNDKEGNTFSENLILGRSLIPMETK